jgi:hypothetical protein
MALSIMVSECNNTPSHSHCKYCEGTRNFTKEDRKCFVIEYEVLVMLITLVGKGPACNVSERHKVIKCGCLEKEAGS